MYSVLELEDALRAPSLPEIVLAAGTYHLTRTLVLNRDVTLTADDPEGAILDGGHQAGEGSSQGCLTTD